MAKQNIKCIQHTTIVRIIILLIIMLLKPYDIDILKFTKTCLRLKKYIRKQNIPVIL